MEDRPYSLQDAVPLLKKVQFAKFDETVDLTLRLGVDPKHADQMVRGTVVLPHGLGKTKRVAVIASGDRVREAEAAGADIVGGEEMVERIQKESWTDFDALIATPDMMKSVGRLGKVLGPRGLMPNPKTGTVTNDVAAAIREIKAGKVEFRTDKTALVHVPVGKLSFPPQKLIDNATTVINSVVRAKPSAAKGKYIRGITLSSTMGPGSRSTARSLRRPPNPSRIAQLIALAGQPRIKRLERRPPSRRSWKRRLFMALTKAKKAVQIDQLAHELEGSTSAIVGTFAKLTVSQDFELRKVVRERGRPLPGAQEQAGGPGIQGNQGRAGAPGVEGRLLGGLYQRRSRWPWRRRSPPGCRRTPSSPSSWALSTARSSRSKK